MTKFFPVLTKAFSMIQVYSPVNRTSCAFKITNSVFWRAVQCSWSSRWDALIWDCCCKAGAISPSDFSRPMSGFFPPLSWGVTHWLATSLNFSAEAACLSVVLALLLFLSLLEASCWRGAAVLVSLLVLIEPKVSLVFFNVFYSPPCAWSPFTSLESRSIQKQLELLGETKTISAVDLNGNNRVVVGRSRLRYIMSNWPVYLLWFLQNVSSLLLFFLKGKSGGGSFLSACNLWVYLNPQKCWEKLLNPTEVCHHLSAQYKFFFDFSGNCHVNCFLGRGRR